MVQRIRAASRDHSYSLKVSRSLAWFWFRSSLVELAAAVKRRLNHHMWSFGFDVRVRECCYSEHPIRTTSDTLRSPDASGGHLKKRRFARIYHRLMDRLGGAVGAAVPHMAEHRADLLKAGVQPARHRHSL